MTEARRSKPRKKEKLETAYEFLLERIDKQT